jgi:hypothetical protein
MTMIALSKPVQVPLGDGRFVTAKAGTKVNYSCQKHENGVTWIHQFSFWGWNEQRMLTYKETGDHQRPDWM